MIVSPYSLLWYSVGQASIYLRTSTEWRTLPEMLAIAAKPYGVSRTLAPGFAICLYLAQILSSHASDADSFPKISASFEHVEVAELIQSLAEDLGINIVLPAPKIGTISFRLHHVRWTAFLDAVLEPLEFNWIHRGNIYWIQPKGALAHQPLETRIIPVDHANASDIAEIAANLVDTSIGETVSCDVRTNALIVTARPNRVKEIGKLLR